LENDPHSTLLSYFPAKTTPEASSGFINVKKRAFTTGYAVRKILELAGEMVRNIKGALRASNLDERTDVVAGMAPGTLTCT